MGGPGNLHNIEKTACMTAFSSQPPWVRERKKERIYVSDQNFEATEIGTSIDLFVLNPMRNSRSTFSGP